MCVLVASDSGIITESEVKNGLRNNPDGCGWAAVTTDGQLIYRKSVKNGWEISQELIQLWCDGKIEAWIWHARIATHGRVIEENCHPFISPDGQSALAHNGILHINTPFGRVDSEYYAEKVIWPLGADALSVAGPAFSTVDEFVTEEYSKIAIVSATAPYPLTILGEKLGTWSADNVWFSNSSCDAVRAPAYLTSTGWKWQDDSTVPANPEASVADKQWWLAQEEGCAFCGEEDDIDLTGVCEACGACSVCGTWTCIGCRVDVAEQDDEDDFCLAGGFDLEVGVTTWEED